MQSLLMEKNKSDNFVTLLKGNKMNKRQILASLNSIANELDKNLLYQEANILTEIMQKIAKKNYDDDSIDEEVCPRCKGDDIDTDKNGKPVICYDCGWPETEDEDRDNEEPR